MTLPHNIERRLFSDFILLAALDAIVAKAHEYGNHSDTPDNAACGFYDIIEDARAAIAKATGQPAP